MYSSGHYRMMRRLPSRRCYSGDHSKEYVAVLLLIWYSSTALLNETRSYFLVSDPMVIERFLSDIFHVPSVARQWVETISIFLQQSKVSLVSSGNDTCVPDPDIFSFLSFHTVDVRSSAFILFLAQRQ